MTIGLFDTSVATHNVGDEIIMDSVERAVFQTFPSAKRVCIPTHEKIYRTSISLIRNADMAIVGGSNILNSSMNKYRQWKIDLIDGLLIRNKVVLLGVGWRSYEGKTNWYTQQLLDLLLNRNFLHSVRDSYTEKKVRELGFTNVINTSCPTMWGLTPDNIAEVPFTKAESVVFTLTDYKKDLVKDRLLIEELLHSYRDVWFWIQGKKDMEYLNEFSDLVHRINVIPPNLRAYDDFLSSNICDYVGTRLHGGIRALQHKRRTIIVGIDNRATEKKRDFDLPVIDRDCIEDIGPMIRDGFETKLRIPFENIERWQKQFI